MNGKYTVSNSLQPVGRIPVHFPGPVQRNHNGISTLAEPHPVYYITYLLVSLVSAVLPQARLIKPT